MIVSNLSIMGSTFYLKDKFNNPENLTSLIPGLSFSNRYSLNFTHYEKYLLFNSP